MRVFVVPALVAIAGALLSIVAYQEQHAASIANWEAALKERAMERVRAMQETIDDAQSMLRSSVGFFEASRRVDQREFSAFARHALKANRSIRLLAWAPRVADAERLRFEGLASLQGDASFQIREPSERGAYRAAPSRAEYFPLLYTASRSAPAEISGLNLAHWAALRHAIDEASLTQRIKAMPAVPRTSEDRSGITILAPAFRNDGIVLGGTRVEEFVGVLLAVVDLPDVIDVALSGLDPLGIDIFLYDNSPRAALLHYESWRSGEEPAVALSFVKARQGLHWASMLQAGDTHWTIVVRPSPALAATAPHTGDLATLLLGLLATAFGTGFLLMAKLRARGLERLTGELRSAMTALSAEMAEREAAQTQLRKSESGYRMLVEQMNEGIAIVDRDQVVTFANRRLQVMLGLEPDELIGRNMRDFIEPQDHELLRSQLGERRHAERASHELRWRRKDGSELITQSAPEPLPSGDGIYKGSFAIFTDITDRVRAEQGVRRRDAVLEAITAAAAELMRTLDLDVALPRAIEIIGRAMRLGRIIVFDGTEASGRATVRLRHEWRADGVTSALPPERRGAIDLVEAGLGRWLDLFRQNRIVIGPVDSFPEPERQVLAAGGGRSVLIVPIQADGQWCGQVGFDDCEGERDWLPAEVEALRTLAELVGMSIARARTHGALADANTIVEGSPAVLFRWGSQDGWTVLYVSQNVTQLGWSSDDLMLGGVTYDQIVLPEDRVRIGLDEEAYLAAGVDRFHQEYRIRTKDGRVLWVQDHTSVVYRDGAVAYLQGTVEDVTARRQAEEALRRATQNLNERVKELTLLHRFASLRSTPGLAVEEIAPQLATLLPDAFRFPDILGARVVIDGQAFAAPDLHETAWRLAGEGRVDDRVRTRVEVFYAEQRWPGDSEPFLVEEALLLQQVATELATTLVQRETEEQLRTAEMIVEKSPIVLYRMTPHDGWPISYVSRNVRQFGYTAEQVLAMPEGADSLVHPADRSAQRGALERALQEGSEHILRQYRLRTADGQHRWVEDHTRITRAGDGQIAVVEGMIIDISDRRRAEEQIAHLARHDALTDLPNRVTFMERLDLAIAQARRGGQPFAVLCIDLDHFKDVNDTRGHAVGDMLLREVAQRLAGTARDTDTVARLGGDEFAILQAQTGDPAAAAALAQRVIDMLARPIDVDGTHIVSGGSVGIAIPSAGTVTAETVMMQADMALYRAKDEGRGTYRFHTQDMDTAVRRRVTIAAELRQAIAGKQLYLDYQPQLDLASGAITGVEALVRWRHPERGLISPGEFIPIAEATGLILQVGAWVLDEALRQGKVWLDAGLLPGVVAVNLSGVQFKAGTFEAEIAQTLAAHDFPPECLELELTESVFMQVTEGRVDTLKSLRDMGVRFAIDDFGTGYSSLEYLRRFHVDRLKIARSFIDGVAPGSSEAAIVEATIGLGKALGVSVLAEGVETHAEMAFLQSRGCHEAQGYLFSRPVSPDKIGALLQQPSLLPAPATTVAASATPPIRAAS